MTAPNKSPNKSVHATQTWWSERTFTDVPGKDTHAPRHRVLYKPLEGTSVTIIGGGPGLKPRIGSALAKGRSIAVNNSYQFYETPALVVALDRRWWQWHGNAVIGAGHLGVTSLRPNQTEPQGFKGVSFDKDRDGPYNTDTGILSGQNSGHAAITLAMHLGADRIYLAGFDMGFKGDKTHWHDGHNVPASSQNYIKRFRPALERLVKDAEGHGVSVAAITPTAADIPSVPLLEALEDLSQ